MIQLPICLMIAAAVAGPEADIAQQVIQSTYGKDLQRVASTSDGSDDIELAKTLLDNAQRPDTGDALRLALAEQAFRLTKTQSDGYAVASGALTLMTAGDPDHAADYDAQRLELELRRYRSLRGEARAESGKNIVTLLQGMATASGKSGDWAAAVRYLQQAQSYTDAVAPDVRDSLSQQFDYSATQLRTTRQIEQIIRRYQANPKDAGAAQSLVRLYVTELDDPTSAATYVQATGDEKLIANLALAQQPLDKLTPEQCVELGNWYQDLAKVASKSGRSSMLNHAHDAYQAAIDSTAVSDQTRMIARLASFQVEKQLAVEQGGDPNGTAKYRIVIWNQHNATYGDRGTSLVNVRLYVNDKEVAVYRNIAVPWNRDRDDSATVNYNGTALDKVRVEVVKWSGLGGGLSEVQIYGKDKLISGGKPARVSASYNPAKFGADKLTDGITDSTTFEKGYWVLPNNTAGWVDIYLTGDPPK